MQGGLCLARTVAIVDNYHTVPITFERERERQTERERVQSRFAMVHLRRFTFTPAVQSDRALPTGGASLSQLKRPFST